jgi:hypothetical protein
MRSGEPAESSKYTPLFLSAFAAVAITRTIGAGSWSYTIETFDNSRLRITAQKLARPVSPITVAGHHVRDGDTNMAVIDLLATLLCSGFPEIPASARQLPCWYKVDPRMSLAHAILPADASSWL